MRFVQFLFFRHTLVQIFVDADACPVVGIIETMAKLKEGAQSGSI